MVNLQIPHNSLRFTVEQDSDVGNCRRGIDFLKLKDDFSEKFIAKAQLVLSELGTNLSKYASQGEIIIFINLEEKEMEIYSLDKGPGFQVKEALEDGFSTGGTNGFGLGAVSRIASHIESFSIANTCTILKFILKESGKYEAAPITFNSQQIVTPIKGQSHSGDGISVVNGSKFIDFLCVDGLGHGIEAAKVARTLTDLFYKDYNLPWADLWLKMHQAIKGLRGGAITLGKVDKETSELQFVGVGNIQCSIQKMGAKSQHLISKPGVFGKVPSLPSIQRVAFNKGDVMTAYSDGLKSLTAVNFPNFLFSQESSIIAAFLYKTLVRNTDDASILVIQH